MSGLAASASAPATTPQPRPLQGHAKLVEVTRLMKTLSDDLESSELETRQRETILEQLRVYGRDPRNADAIYCKAGIEILSQYSFESKSPSTSREALRCIANALVLAPNLRQVFADLDYPSKAAEKLKSPDTDDEFLLSRILFLLTYETKFDFNPLFEHHVLGESINAHVLRHANSITHDGQSHILAATESAALSESLKLLFNLSNFYPKRTDAFTESIDSIFQILNHITIPKPPLEPPVNYLINALANLNLEHRATQDMDFAFPSADPDRNVDKLVQILDQAISAYQPTQLEPLVVPIITLLRKMYDFAPEEAKIHVQKSLLPRETDRDLPIGQSDTLSSRLLRLSTSPVAPNVREGLSSLLFELSGKDASQFVRNVGYGFAAGYLMSHDIQVPQSARETRGDDASAVPINPITGQRLDKEPVGEEPEMTMEEKEREAEKLFVLFDRLRATGVMDVQNPVRQAMEEGRFDHRIEEIDGPD